MLCPTVHFSRITNREMLKTWAFSLKVWRLLSLNLAHKVLLVHKVNKALPVHKVNKATQAHKALPAPLVRKGNKALLVSPVGILMAMANPTKTKI